MDQIKIGTFLKTLRAEKNLTQEALAEKFNVSSRTVSRWETGSNMPDLSILVELADYYGVDIREIFNGERKNGKMDSETKETLQKAAEYADIVKAKLLKRVQTASIIGLICFIPAVVLMYLRATSTLPIFNYPVIRVLSGMLTGIAGGSMIGVILYVTGIMEKIYGKKENRIIMTTVLILGIIACIALLVVSTVFSI